VVVFFVCEMDVRFVVLVGFLVVGWGGVGGVGSGCGQGRGWGFSGCGGVW